MLKDFADDLKSLRKGKDITLEEISAQTRLRVSVLQKLESGDFTFQPAAYIKAFLKQYASAINENPQEIINNFLAAKEGRYKRKSSGFNEKIELTSTADDKIPETPDQEKTLPRKLPERDRVEKIRSEEKMEEKSAGDYYSGSFFSGERLKKIILYLVGAGFLVGIFFMVKALFFTDDAEEQEIVRQRGFNEVLMENERKLLGKRTEEEIQDSIRKAQEEMMKIENRDSISLEIIAKGKGKIFLAIDSVNFNNPTEYAYLPGDTGLYFAEKFFHFGVNDPSTIEVLVNDIKVKLPQRRFRNLLIDSSGVNLKPPNG
ncbi:MAG: helix-turn-helix transcriptional regulator [Ignavibacteriaceae bacterium]|jgi:transcriptional regulator with XRE-family HTH domain|nr:MAG: transcriptional regulator, XRE family [Chlorobi bacterium OLB4]MBW7855922.1 helix-turn-helix domain-containing protein [Ignavibacteria bacterium]MEB2329669.1 helix-turn-helix transcriptional regulator [Ignavibacteriaceae bacterium]OQY77287.1 MAG: hypothetical protein B6D43_06670 [Ignavibacteriales bacterium UTCHB1]